MSNIPSDAVKIEVAGATVDFFKEAKDGQSTYYFDTSKNRTSTPNGKRNEWVSTY